jgi:hypothetical protein
MGVPSSDVKFLTSNFRPAIAETERERERGRKREGGRVCVYGMPTSSNDDKLIKILLGRCSLGKGLTLDRFNAAVPPCAVASHKAI